MQKLVTIYLDSHAYAEGKWLKASNADKHGHVEEYLKEYLADGWVIRSLQGFGGGSEHPSVRGWLAVVLEKGEPHGSQQAEEGAGRQA